MRSKLSAITARTPSSLGPFAAQSREEPVPYSLPPMHDGGNAFALVALRRVEDRHRIARRIMDRVAAFGAAHHFVPDADVGEGAALHHFVIAAPRAVGIEILLADLMLLQIDARRARSA